MTIEKLAVKCGAIKYEAETPQVYYMTLFELQAFADEWLALNSNNPIAWRQTIHITDKGIERIEYGYSDIQIMIDDVPLYKANPTNQELLDSHKRLDEALDTLISIVGLTAFKHESQLAVLQDAVNIGIEALSSTPKSVKELK